MRNITNAIIAFALLITAIVSMGAISRVKVWTVGETLTSSDLNTEFNNIINNFDASSLDGASANVAAMQTVVDPGELGTESLASDLAGELHRLRFMISELSGQSQWYVTSPRTLATGSLSVLTGDIVDGTILGADIDSDTIALGNMASNSVDSDNIVANTIVSDDIATGGVASIDILDATITTADISASAGITGTQIADETITTFDIDNNTILNDDINATAGIVRTKLDPSPALNNDGSATTTSTTSTTFQAVFSLTSPSVTALLWTGFTSDTDDTVAFARLENTSGSAQVARGEFRLAVGTQVLEFPIEAYIPAFDTVDFPLNFNFVTNVPASSTISVEMRAVTSSTTISISNLKLYFARL